jgi:hypothetical protein
LSGSITPQSAGLATRWKSCTGLPARMHAAGRRGAGHG